MKRDLKELIQLLKKTKTHKENAILVTTAINDERDNAYKYSAYIKGKYKLCKEAAACLLDVLVDDEKDDVDGQLALINFFEHKLKMKKRALEEET